MSDRQFGELLEVATGHLKALVSEKALAKGLANDIAELHEDIRRMEAEVSAIVDPNSTSATVKAALQTLGTWAWHTSDHLKNIHAILEEEYD